MEIKSVSQLIIKLPLLATSCNEREREREREREIGREIGRERYIMIRINMKRMIKR